jgi:hypothetical protein
LRGQAVERAVFGRFVEEGVAEVGLAQHAVGGEQAGGQLVQVAMGGGIVKDRIAGIAALAEIFSVEQAAGIWSRWPPIAAW